MGPEKRDQLHKLDENNRTKYGPKQNDLIARTYAKSQQHGDLWCVNNALKYLERFITPGSVKAAQLIDLIKAKDYIDRAIEKHPDNFNKNVENITEHQR